MNHYHVEVATAAIVAFVSITFAQLASAESQRYPDVVAVNAQARGENRFDFDVTIPSPYDAPLRYADAYRFVSVDGVSYGERKLLHDHASEQPFTRDLYGVHVPVGVRAVVVQARDQQHGYGGKAMQVELPGQ